MSTQTESLTLKVYPRKGSGKSAAFRSRLEKLVPAIVYGPEMKTPIQVSLPANETVLTYRKVGRTTLLTVEAVDGAPAELNGAKVLIKEIQAHPLKNTLLHVDLHKLDLKRKVRVTVPLNFTGKAKGLSEGGLMSIASRQVVVKVLPTDIPQHLDVDVSKLGVNESIHISDLAKSFEAGKFEFMYESDYAIVAVVPPEEEKAAEVVAAPGAEGAAAAPGAPAAAGAKAAPGAAPAAGAKPAAGAPAAAAKAPAKK